ncbi:DUF4231 domain-containing protein [Nonomuraea sp. NPDC059007]|uniref:DUF4231 domain-containing protein n=1 Tax=Nonomuraea sp. NPDC059007 TaxID=3346692 RepID=UPI0036C390F3
MAIIRDTDELEQIARIESQIARNRFFFNIFIVTLIILAAPLLILLWLWFADSDIFSAQSRAWVLLGTAGAYLLIILFSIALRTQRYTLEGELRAAHARKRYQATPSRAATVGDPLTQFETARFGYPVETLDYVELAKRKAARSRKAFRTSQLVISLGSISVTFLTGLNSAIDPSNLTSLGAAIVSLIVSFTTAVSALFKWREQSFNLQQTANSIEREYSHLELSILDYKDRATAFPLFAERVEKFKQEQRDRELQLELSPEKSSSPHQSAGGGGGNGQAISSS